MKCGKPLKINILRASCLYMKQSVIYKITNPNGRTYVGQTQDWITRQSKYRRLHFKAQRILYNSFLKYGNDAHILEIIECCEPELLNEREMYWIETLKTNNNRYPENDGMNCSDGGGTSRGFKHTEESKGKISKKMNQGKNSRNPNRLPQLKVIDSDGTIYKNVREAARAVNMNYVTLRDQLKGRYTNKTSLKFF